MEESPKERALALAKRAKTALPLEEMAALPTGEQAAIRMLASAIELLTDDPLNALLRVDLGESGLAQLENLRASAAAVVASGERKFVVSFPDVELTLDQVWPDRDAPENPTPQDVIEQMRSCTRSVQGIASEWCLIESLYVGYDDDELSEVEWDGA
jgi:hypothetical protein